jgi:hypothetical protein
MKAATLELEPAATLFCKVQTKPTSTTESLRHGDGTEKIKGQFTAEARRKPDQDKERREKKLMVYPNQKLGRKAHFGIGNAEKQA